MSAIPDSDLTLESLVHDLTNVFDTIQDTAEGLARDAKYARQAARLQRAATRGQRILSSYLEQSQASLELDSILDEAIEWARELQAARGPQIEFVRNIEPGLRLRGSYAGWLRAFMNLFLNAAQAMGETPGTVEIEARREAGAIAITVADNGPGISPKVLPRIFEPRFSTKAKRSGLGLHIVRTFVEKAGGTVEAANRPSGQGAQFNMTLPG